MRSGEMKDNEASKDRRRRSEDSEESRGSGKHRWLEQQSTKLMIAQTPRTVQRKASGKKVLLVPVISILLLAATFSYVAVSPGRFSLFPFSSQPTPTVQLAPSSQIVEKRAPDIIGTEEMFMGDMLRKQWGAMWNLLSPDAQKTWQGEQDFVHFEQSKFGAVILKSYSASLPVIESNWRDPDTTQLYSSVAVMSVSLQLTASAKLVSVPTLQALQKGLFDQTLFALVQSRGSWLVLVAGPADAEAPILVPAKLPAVTLTVPIMMYHHVSNKPAPNLLEYNLTVTTTDFDQQLTWLQQHGYQSISETDLFDAFYYGKALPAHPVMLTFDDGYEDMYTDALPVLLAHHDRGVFYIITGMIGGDYLTWNQVRTLAHNGMQIASHTIHHVNVGDPPAWTSTQAELQVSKQTLEQQLHEPIQFFCYPSGEPFHNDTYTEQQAVLADLFNDGYVGATLDPLTLDSALQNAQTPYQLNRIRVSGGEDLQTFVGILDAVLSRSVT
ncbi:MAG TPA: polysaccharide deacetylase family protein [Ktedonobacteraceae bacterium]|nr:polysaccharide deacetylase family protein [Ktedonobacteraceae bacterium]